MNRINLFNYYVRHIFPNVALKSKNAHFNQWILQDNTKGLAYLLSLCVKL